MTNRPPVFASPSTPAIIHGQLGRMALAQRLNMTRRTDLLEALASTPADVTRLVRSLDEATAVWRVAPDEWSCRDVVNHLRYVEPLYLARLRRVLAEDEPSVPYIHPDTLPDDPALTIAALAEDFRLARAETLALLRDLRPGQWQRAAIHERKGRQTLRYLVDDLVAHDIDHSHQLVEIMSWRRAFLKELAAATDRRDDR